MAMHLRVDFNSLSEDGRLVQTVTTDRVEVDDTVVLLDHDENWCWGTVRQVNGRLVQVEPEWDTWVASMSDFVVHAENPVTRTTARREANAGSPVLATGSLRVTPA